MKHQHVLIALFSVAILTLLLIVYSVKIAPIFTGILVLSICTIFLFMASETYFIHSAAEFENRFWTSVACVLAIALFFADDSPLVSFSEGAIPSWVSWGCITLVAFGAHNYHRQLCRAALTRVPSFNKAAHTESSSAEVDEIMKLLYGIDNPWISSALTNIFMLPRVLWFESHIVDIFRKATTNNLNQIIAHIELGLIIYKIKDHFLTGHTNRTDLLKVLVNERLQELSVPSRAMLLDALMKLHISAHVQSEEFVRTIIKNTKLDDLSELKSLTDSKGDFNSMHKLVYIDIRSQQIREEILKHISKNAKEQEAHSKISSKMGKRRNQFAWRKVLSDIDDTLTCSFGPSLAGVDRSYPPKATYPGVLAFYRELDTGTVGADDWGDRWRSNLVFLSARPHIYKDMTENVSFAKFKALKETKGMHTTPSLLAGSMGSGSQFLFQGLMDPLAQKKYDNFIEYLTLYPEFQCIFVGDNGQGDVRVSEMIYDEPTYRDKLLRVYIHEVQPLSKTHTLHEITKTRCAKNICYFKSYIDAALDAFHHKLIRCTGLRRVCLESVRDFEVLHRAISMRQWREAESKGEVGQKESRLGELNAALRRANEVLRMNLLPEIPLLKYEQKYAIHTPVSTAFGRGILMRFRATDGINEVHIPVHVTLDLAERELWEQGFDLSEPDVAQNTPVKLQFLKCFLHNKDITLFEQKIYKSVLTLNMVAKSSESFLGIKKFEDVVGSVVWSTYGLGRVTKFRKSDGVYCVVLAWGTLYALPSKLIRISDACSKGGSTGVKSRSNSLDLTGEKKGAAVGGLVPQIASTDGESCPNPSGGDSSSSSTRVLPGGILSTSSSMLSEALP